MMRMYRSFFMEHHKMLRRLFLAISTRPPIAALKGPDHRNDVLPISGPGACNFIAMEYYAGILNRTFLVSAFSSGIGAMRVRGVMANPGYMAPDIASNPMTYADPGILQRYRNASSDPKSFLNLDGANFYYSMPDIVSISTDMSRKWGMGNVRYSGRIVLHLEKSKPRELIFLGVQDVQRIADELKNLWQQR